MFITFCFLTAVKIFSKKKVKNKTQEWVVSRSLPDALFDEWMTFSSLFLANVGDLQKKCPSQRHLGRGSHSFSLIMTSSPQTCLSRSPRGFQTSVSKHASSKKTHRCCSKPFSGPLSMVPLPLALPPKEILSDPRPGKISHEAKNRQSRWVPPH